ncbi:MAG: class I SAM-dependent methyltransferase [Rhizobiales bacterium]|jgi:predicted O-methyltransferase YrrM|nr:class I SAM-dependent methyltransferase [Hyphomicrobiales bacterium]
MLNAKYRLKRMVRSALVPLIYRYPPSVLAPERLYLYLHHLIETKNVPGAVVEIGCNLGGTAIMARRMLGRLGINKPYVCIDTFDGFVENQFAADVTRGSPSKDQNLFSGNSRELVSRILQRHGCGDIRLIQGDVTVVPDAALPPQCSIVLLDVDLTEPTYVSLQRFWPRLAPGGVILVDDCQENASWKAQVGYSRFCRENRLPERYMHGMGLLARAERKAAEAA